jgi:hypothetical protein
MKRGGRFQRAAIFFSIFVLGSLALVLRVGAQSDQAQEKPWERFSLNLGGFVTSLNTDVSIGVRNVGISVDAEEALGLDTNMSVFRGDAILRLGDSRRHRLDFGFLDLKRSGTKTLGRDITIGDTVYPLGTTVETEFDLSLFKGAYSYSLVQDAKIDFGLGIGLYVAPIKFRISSTRSGGVEEESVTAPLPFLGVRLDYAITPKLFIKQSVDFFYMEYNQFKGRLLDAKIGIEYNIWKHFGLGLAYNFFYMDVESEGETIDWKGSINFGFSGLMLYGKVMF